MRRRVLETVLAGLGCLGLAAPAMAQPEALSSWERYTDFRAYYFREPEPTERDQLEIAEARIRLGLRYNRLFADGWLFDGDVRAVATQRHRDPGRDRTVTHLEIKRLHLRNETLFGNPFYWIDIGRDRIQSPRAWLYDDDMDQLRLGYDSTLLDIEAGIAGWLWDGRIGGDSDALSRDEQQEAVGSFYLFGSAEYQWYRNHFAGFHIVGEDFDLDESIGTRRITDPDDLTSRAELTFLGLSLHGKRSFGPHALDYAFDVATSRGEHRFLQVNQRGTLDREIEQDIDGLGWDARLIGRFDHNRWAIGFAHARGDGEAGTPADADTFRQPQIATDKDSVLGVARYRYYGEALAPRLSNMSITSAWAGAAITESFWIEGAYHRYRQRNAQPWMFSERGVFLPNGRSRDIGRAVDLVAGGRLREDMDLLMVAGAFFDGNAFDGVTTDDIGYRFTVELNVRW